jgi:hypothetical protein
MITIMLKNIISLLIQEKSRRFWRFICISPSTLGMLINFLSILLIWPISSSIFDFDYLYNMLLNLALRISQLSWENAKIFNIAQVDKELPY